MSFATGEVLTVAPTTSCANPFTPPILTIAHVRHPLVCRTCAIVSMEGLRWGTHALLRKTVKYNTMTMLRTMRAGSILSCLEALSKVVRTLLLFVMMMMKMIVMMMSMMMMMTINDDDDDDE